MMNEPKGFLILAVSFSVKAAGQGEPMEPFLGILKLVIALGGLVVVLTAARWLYSWYQCRKVTRTATESVKERVARGQKPYC